MISDLKETEIQKLVRAVLSDPSEIFATNSGKRMQILSPGRLNKEKGPDFLEMALFIGGSVVVCDGEFHRNASDWLKHKHNEDPNYDSVALHVVFNCDWTAEDKFDTLVMNENEVFENSLHALERSQKEKRDIASIEDLQDFALLRLLRKTADAKKILNYSSIEDSLRLIVSRFLDRYYKRKRRPVYSDSQIRRIPEKILNSQASSFLKEVKSGDIKSTVQNFNKLNEAKIADEGKSLRGEIALNCVLPLALCLAYEKTRIELFQWYWSAPAVNRYGVLSRRFENIDQKYLWQQQGMLEYLKEYGGKQKTVSEAVKSYGFAEVLDFYRVGREPLDNIKR